MDQLSTIQTALDTDRYFNGNGQTFEILGDIDLPDFSTLENVELIQLDTANGSHRRSIKKIGGYGITLNNVKVDKGANGKAGQMGPGFEISAGLYLRDVANARVDVEVTGNGLGAGVYIQDCPALSPDSRINIHDMQFESDSSVAHEKLVGIWMNYFGDRKYDSRFTLNEPIVRNITSKIAGVVRPYQTDGITLGGTFQSRIIRPSIKNCGELIDVTGSEGNTGLSIIGGILEDADSWGIKFANSARFCTVDGTVIINAGWSAVVISGPSEAGLQKCEEIHVKNVLAVNTGSSGRWSAQNIAAFGILQGAYEPTYPQHVIFENCRAKDNQAVRTMKYGFRNENNNTTNRLVGCNSSGHTVSANLGTWG